jgi:tyrosine-protein kinase Etk/Wzc
VSKTVAPSSNNGYSGGAGEITLSETISLVWGGRRTIAVMLGVILLLDVLYTLLTKPVYESTARILVESKVKQGTSTVLDFTGTSSAAKITNEIETLTSFSLADSVACALTRERFLGGVSGQLVPIIRAGESDDGGHVIATTSVIADRLLKVVEFTSVKESDIIKVTARSAEPREAALIANTYTRVYRDRNRDLSREKSRQIREFLQSQLHTKQQALDSAESALRSYMQTTGVISLDAETSKMVTQLAQLEAARDALDLDIRTKSTTLQSYRDELAREEPNIAKAMGQSNDAYIRLLQEQLARLEVQRDVVISQNPSGTSQGGYSAQLKEVDYQIVSLRKNLQARTKEFLNTLSPGDRSSGANEGSAGYLAQLKQRIVEQSIELDGLTAKQVALARVIADYERQFNSIPKRSIDLAKLQRSRMSNEKLYLLVDEKFNEAAITEKSDFGYVSIIDPAVVPIKPVSPKVWLNLLLGALLGFGVGVGSVLIRAAIDVRLRAPEDVENCGYSILAVINQMQLAGRIRTRSSPKSRNSRDYQISLVAHTHASSPLVEGYRHLYRSLKQAEAEKPLKSILVTSVSQGEGKSTTVSNLAIVMAEAEKRVLLLDADLRRPSIHSTFELPRSPGLVEVLMRKAILEEVIHRDVVPNLDIVTSGLTPPSPGALLGSTKMQETLRELELKYDIVLIDCAPLFAVTDAYVLAANVVGIVLVVSAGQTRTAELHRAVRSLTDFNERIQGVVLNNYNVRKTYRPSTGGYGYGAYGADYAYRPESKRGSR